MIGSLTTPNLPPLTKAEIAVKLRMATKVTIKAVSVEYVGAGNKIKNPALTGLK
jgi:hypothetical protein